jgi:FkbM family methyltransferase
VNPAHSFYSNFVAPGDTVFDIGANLGNRTETFVALGARVVAVEPQAELAQQLRDRYAGNPNVTVLDCALSDSAGEAEMLISDAHTLSTLATEWPEKVTSSGRFADNTWNEKRIVRTRTLASLIEQHGAPAFCKIDVSTVPSPRARSSSPRRTWTAWPPASSASPPLARSSATTRLARRWSLHGPTGSPPGSC